MRCLTFQKIKKGEVVFEYGEKGELFYIIIKGACCVHIRNDKIKDWYNKYHTFKRLMHWRNNEFEQKVKIAQL